MSQDSQQADKRSWKEAFFLYWQAKESSPLRATIRRFLLAATATLGFSGIIDEFLGGWTFGPLDDVPWILLVIITLWRVYRFRTIPKESRFVPTKTNPR